LGFFLQELVIIDVKVFKCLTLYYSEDQGGGYEKGTVPAQSGALQKSGVVLPAQQVVAVAAHEHGSAEGHKARPCKDVVQKRSRQVQYS